MRVGWPSWSLELHPGWAVSEDPECLTVTASEFGGALQLSSVRKDLGAVTAEDIHGFITEASWGTPHPVSFGGFKGVGVSYTEDNSCWFRWWLSNKSLLVFVTYNCPAAVKATELPHVTTMLQSLKVERAGA